MDILDIVAYSISVIIVVWITISYFYPEGFDARDLAVPTPPYVREQLASRTYISPLYFPRRIPMYS